MCRRYDAATASAQALGSPAQANGSGAALAIESIPCANPKRPSRSRRVDSNSLSLDDVVMTSGNNLKRRRRSGWTVCSESYIQIGENRKNGANQIRTVS